MGYAPQSSACRAHGPPPLGAHCEGRLGGCPRSGRRGQRDHRRRRRRKRLKQAWGSGRARSDHRWPSYLRPLAPGASPLAPQPAPCPCRLSPLQGQGGRCEAAAPLAAWAAALPCPFRDPSPYLCACCHRLAHQPEGDRRRRPSCAPQTPSAPPPTCRQTRPGTWLQSPRPPPPPRPPPSPAPAPSSAASAPPAVAPTGPPAATTSRAATLSALPKQPAARRLASPATALSPCRAAAATSIPFPWASIFTADDPTERPSMV